MSGHAQRQPAWMQDKKGPKRQQVGGHSHQQTADELFTALGGEKRSSPQSVSNHVHTNSLVSQLNDSAVIVIYVGQSDNDLNRMLVDQRKSVR